MSSGPARTLHRGSLLNSGVRPHPFSIASRKDFSSRFARAPFRLECQSFSCPRVGNVSRCWRSQSVAVVDCRRLIPAAWVGGTAAREHGRADETARCSRSVPNHTKVPRSWVDLVPAMWVGSTAAREQGEQMKPRAVLTLGLVPESTAPARPAPAPGFSLASGQRARRTNLIDWTLVWAACPPARPPGLNCIPLPPHLGWGGAATLARRV